MWPSPVSTISFHSLKNHSRIKTAWFLFQSVMLWFLKVELVPIQILSCLLDPPMDYVCFIRCYIWLRVFVLSQVVLGKSITDMSRAVVPHVRLPLLSPEELKQVEDESKKDKLIPVCNLSQGCYVANLEEVTEHDPLWTHCDSVLLK